MLKKIRRTPWFENVALAGVACLFLFAIFLMRSIW